MFFSLMDLHVTWNLENMQKKGITAIVGLIRGRRTQVKLTVQKNQHYYNVNANNRVLKMDQAHNLPAGDESHTTVGVNPG